MTAARSHSDSTLPNAGGVRIVSWNLGHQTRESALKSVFLPTIEFLAADVLVLNEFVDGPSRAQLRTALSGSGLGNVQTSVRIGSNNQILIASRWPLHAGAISSVGLDDTAESNFLSVATGSPVVQVVGMRAPAYDSHREVKAFWTAFDQIVRASSGQPVVYIGDMNADPDDASSIGGRALARLRVDGWTIPEPAGEWSFARGVARTRIDHAIVTPAFNVGAAAYCVAVGDLRCAGVEHTQYDHAPLCLDIAMARSQLS